MSNSVAWPNCFVKLVVVLPAVFPPLCCSHLVFPVSLLGVKLNLYIITSFELCLIRQIHIPGVRSVASYPQPLMAMTKFYHSSASLLRADYRGSSQHTLVITSGDTDRNTSCIATGKKLSDKATPSGLNSKSQTHRSLWWRMMIFAQRPT